MLLSSTPALRCPSSVLVRHQYRRFKRPVIAIVPYHCDCVRETWLILSAWVVRDLASLSGRGHRSRKDRSRGRVQAHRYSYCLPQREGSRGRDQVVWCFPSRDLFDCQARSCGYEGAQGGLGIFAEGIGHYLPRPLCVFGASAVLLKC